MQCIFKFVWLMRPRLCPHRPMLQLAEWGGKLKCLSQADNATAPWQSPLASLIQVLVLLDLCLNWQGANQTSTPQLGQDLQEHSRCAPRLAIWFKPMDPSPQGVPTCVRFASLLGTYRG